MKYRPSLVPILGVFIAVLLIAEIKRQWPTDPGGVTFAIKPIEKHAKIAASLLRSGDTLLFVPDHVKRYWSGPFTLPAISNFTFNGGGVMWCMGEVDGANCDVVIPNPHPAPAILFTNSNEKSPPH